MQKIEQELQEVGAHYALSRRRRHPSTMSFLQKNQRNTVRNKFSLTAIVEQLDIVLTFIQECGKKKHTILFATSRNESLTLIKEIAETMQMPFVIGRWVGGLLSNFDIIKKRIIRLKKLREEKEMGVWQKHTKKEGVLLQRELSKLENRFFGILNLEKLPDALFVIDIRQEKIAITEARKMGIPVIGLVNADANVSIIDYPIVTNINSRKNVTYVLNKVQAYYKKGFQGAGN